VAGSASGTGTPHPSSELDDSGTLRGVPEDRQRVSPRDRLALALAFAGLILLAAGGALFSLSVALILPGIGLFCLAVLIAAGV
jgi:fatty acid desaturase